MNCVVLDLFEKLWFPQKFIVVVIWGLGPHKYASLCMSVCLDSAFREPLLSDTYRSVFSDTQRERKKSGSAAEMCFLSRVHFLSVCVGGVGCPPAAARGMFVVDCLQALSQTQLSGRSALNWRSNQNKRKTCLFFLDSVVSKLFIITHSRQ